ncbi:MAG: histidine phosphatase family protein [Hornefia sp.]|nr:histidine phosphatase family protein [Hornefia sp.]
MVSKLILIRHGITEGNEKKWFYGKTDLPLLEKGKDMLFHYREQGVYPEIPKDAQKIVSGLTRTKETMEILFGSGEWTEIPNLQEMNFGDFECHSFEEVEKKQDFRRWVYDETENVRTPGGESRKEFVFRVKTGLKELIGLHRLKEWSHRHGGEDAVTVTVCHGGVISSIMQELFPDENHTMWDWIPEPGLGYVIDFKEGEVAGYSKIEVKKERQIAGR